jgi:ADP-ribose pyrophosphatase YjhB (NUDIX family)
MINCFFENGNKATKGLRHVTVGAIAVNDKNEVLLVKRSQDVIGAGKYAVPGGFLDRGEDTKRGTLRELKEETGFDGEIISLLKINDNPNRRKEDRQNVDFLYVVRIIGSGGKLDQETDKIEWFSKDMLPGEDDFAFDHRDAILEYFNKS